MTERTGFGTVMPPRSISHDDFASNIAEGFHTAFRKGTDHPSSAAIWRMIKNLPPEEWVNIIDWGRHGHHRRQGCDHRGEEEAMTVLDWITLSILVSALLGVFYGYVLWKGF